MKGKTTVPEHVDRFAAYYANNPAWGCMHIVLDEGNVTDDDAAYCVRWAQDSGDSEGESLATVLTMMSRTQRGKIARMAEARCRELFGKW